jgi:hypothetical protein
MDKLARELNWGKYRLSRFDSQRLGPLRKLHSEGVAPVMSVVPRRDGA